MSELKEITAVILGGGQGSRLRNVVSDRQKVLASVKGRPFLEYLLMQLVSSGVSYVVLCIGYLGRQVQERFGDSYQSLRIAYSHETSPLGTAGALRKAETLFRSDDLLVMNGDSYCAQNLQELWLWHCKKHSDITLLLVQMPDTIRYGNVEVNEQDRIVSFTEKNAGRDVGWINAGIYILKRYLLSDIPQGRKVSLERDIFSIWLAKGMFGYKSIAPFLDIGTPESYAKAEGFFS